MKNKLFLLIFVSVLLPSCSNNEVHEIPPYLIDFLSTSRKSFSLKALEEEILFDKKGNKLLTNEYNYDFLIDTHNNFGITKKVFTDTFSSSINYVKDELGFVSLETINHKNEVILKNVLDNQGSKINFDIEFINPFFLLEENDFVKLNENSFSLNNKKQLFATKLLDFQYVIDDVIFNFENNNIKSIDISSIEYEIQYKDPYKNEYILADLVYNTKILIDNLGTSDYEYLLPAASKDPKNESRLKDAFNKIGSNYTMIINEHMQGEKGNSEYDSYWYFNGEDKVYHQQQLSNTSRLYDLYYKVDNSIGDNLLYYHDFDETNESWFISPVISSQSYNNDPKPYEWFLSKINETSPLLFSYNEDEDIYVCDNKYAIGYIGNNFLPGSYAISYFTNGAGNKCEIKLTDSGEIDFVTVGYYKEDTQGFDVSMEYKMRFINIGKTIIPEWVEG